MSNTSEVVRYTLCLECELELVISALLKKQSFFLISPLLLVATLLQIHNSISFDTPIHQGYDHLLPNVVTFVFNDRFWNILFLSISSTHTLARMTWPYLLSSRHSTLYSHCKKINNIIGAHKYIVLLNKNFKKVSKYFIWFQELLSTFIDLSSLSIISIKSSLAQNINFIQI